jgi:hypothetical protein
MLARPAEIGQKQSFNSLTDIPATLGIDFVFTTTCETRCDEATGFPSGLRPLVRDVAALLARTETHAPSDVFMVKIDHETLEIPYRLYYSRELLRLKLHTSYGIKKLVLACLGTRHHDGYLRQQCLGYLLRSEACWVIPYIVQLAGEYVVEIANEVADGILSRDSSSIAEFARRNPDYLATFGRRVTSYWNEYYRSAYPCRDDYPGTKVLAQLMHSLE